MFATFSTARAVDMYFRAEYIYLIGLLVAFLTRWCRLDLVLNYAILNIYDNLRLWVMG